jgi:hypothetical protein
MYPDRIYGWFSLIVQAETSEEAIGLVERYLGYRPPIIKAGPDVVLKILEKTDPEPGSDPTQ